MSCLENTRFGRKDHDRKMIANNECTMLDYDGFHHDSAIEHLRTKGASIAKKCIE